MAINPFQFSKRLKYLQGKDLDTFGLLWGVPRGRRFLIFKERDSDYKTRILATVIGGR